MLSVQLFLWSKYQQSRLRMMYPNKINVNIKGKVYMVLLLQFQYQKEVLRFTVQLAQTLTLSYQMWD